jgi:exo-beta-1,3-glucanase (GH17 family)
MGIAYSPYGPGGSCKDKNAVAADIKKLAGYSVIRLYGTDCKQVANAIPAAKAAGMTIFAGVFDIAKAGVQAKELIDQVNGDWASISTVGVGNESVNKGEASPAQVVAALGTVKAALKSAGYSGPVVAPDTFIAMINNPQICQASDYAAANCHAFFDPNTSAKDAGKFLKTQQARVEKACGKKVVITETGWPTKGSSNGQAIPSADNQATAIGSIKSAYKDSPSSIIMFSAFDDAWKKDSADTFNAEKHWGMLG